jgi:hypothetical protein
VFQLHPGAWRFAAGHVPKLELLGQDAPYARPSNGQFQIRVSNLQLRLPVHERPNCTTRPYSTLNKRRVRATPALLVASGRAGEHSCVIVSAATRGHQQVKHVYVMIYRPSGAGRCRFVQRNGQLTAPRSCHRPVEFAAAGTTRWHLRLRISLASGSYLVRSDAVDANRRHQPRTAASVTRVTVRGAAVRPVSRPSFTG